MEAHMTRNEIQNEKNLELVRRIQAGDHDAENELLRANDGLVGAMVRHYRATIPPDLIDDYRNAGQFGILRAAQRFDPGRKCKFSTVAMVYIKHEFRNLWRDQARMNRVDGITFDERFGIGECPMAEREDEEARSRAIERALSVLPPRDRAVVSGYFGLEGKRCTLAVLGNRFHYTRERIRQIKMKALEKMKVALTEAVKT
jgi:RNA polymerase sigma factor (sigma-70 family)